MTHRMQQSHHPVISATYEALVVRPPNNALSGFVRIASLLLVVANAIAYVASYAHVASAAEPWIIGGVEIFSTAFFAAEYVLRLSGAAAEPDFRGRLRFALRPLSLIDLAAILPLPVASFAGSYDAALHVLRIGWLVRQLKILRYLAFRPLVHGSESLVQSPADRLAEIRRRVAEAREQDFSGVQRSVRAAVRRCLDVVRAERGESRLASVMKLLDELEGALTAAERVRAPVSVTATAFRESAGVFDDSPETAAVDVALAPGFAGQKTVPLREIGRHHFAGLASLADRLSESKDPLYVADVRRELARVRTAIAAAVADGRGDDSAIARAVDLLRDVDAPVRLSWDALLFQFEDEHRSRLQLVRTDVERHGHPWFYASRTWRWLARHLGATLHAGELTIRLWTKIVRFYRDAAASIARAVRQTLLRLGVLRPPMHEMLLALDEARIDSVLEKGLPKEYIAHFDVSEPRDDGLWIGFDDELGRLRTVVERWRERHLASFVVYGHRGVGKTTFLQQARAQLFAGEAVVHEILTKKLAATDLLVAHLARLLGVREDVAPEELAGAVLAGPRRTVFLDDAHHLFFRTIGGLDAVRYLFWLIAKTNHHVLWGVSFDRCGYDFLAQICPLEELFHLHVNLDERKSEALRRLIMARHDRSGASLHYVRDKRNEKAFRRRMKALRQRNRTGQAHPQEALELIYFDGLAAATAGNVLVAAFYWLRSLRVAEEDRFHVEPFEPLDLSLIWDFSEDQAFILSALLQHGVLTTPDLGRVLDVDPIGLRLELEILANLNVLQAQVATDTFRVNPVVQQTVCDVLRARNLLR